MSTRREFAAGLGSAALGLGLSSCGHSYRPPYKAILVSPKVLAMGEESVWGISVVDLKKATESFINIGFRGHSVVRHPTDPNRVIMFPQRPGTRSAEIDLVEKQIIKTFDAVKGRHFYGHGCLSPQGEALFCAENDPETGLGSITVRDDRTHQVLSEFPSFGVGPHDMKLLADGRTLLIGNGGLHIQPGEKGAYEAVNISDVRASLAFVDIQSGELLEKVSVDIPGLSVRHLDVDGNDVYIGLQFANQRVPGQSLVARYQRGAGKLEFFDMSEEVYKQIDGQTLSLASAGNRVLAMTHSNGNPIRYLTLWDIPSQKHLESVDLSTNASGVALAPGGGEFLVTVSDGRLKNVSLASFAVGEIPVQGGYRKGSWGSHASIFEC